jgi:hypothetical protein
MTLLKNPSFQIAEQGEVPNIANSSQESLKKLKTGIESRNKTK